MKFTIKITRTVIQHTEVEIEADSAEEACEMAEEGVHSETVWVDENEEIDGAEVVVS